MDDEVVLTRVYKRGACWFVEGRVLRRGQWLTAAFTAHAPDVEGLSREAFEAFARRQLPHVTEDVKWDEVAHVGTF